MFEGMFGMMNSYKERKVLRYDDGVTLSVDTCSVSDGAHPYETAVAHVGYNRGSWVVVEAYDTHEESIVGHEKWVKIMTAETLPDKLVDCCNCTIGQIIEEFEGKPEYPLMPLN
jgi:hypothetical protein